MKSERGTSADRAKRGAARAAVDPAPRAPTALQRFQSAAGNHGMRQLLAGAPTPAAERALRSQGAPLPSALREEMEERYGEDLTQVRLHAGGVAATAADAAGAKAFTYGSHIVFGHGQFDVASGKGRKLLAHELAHVVQQSRSGPSPDAADLAALECSGERAADAVIHGAGTVRVEGASARSIARDSLDALPKTEFVEVGPNTQVLRIDGIALLTVTLPEDPAKRRLQLETKIEGKRIAVIVEYDFWTNVKFDTKGAEALAAKGYELDISANQRDSSFAEQRIDVESRSFQVLPPPLLAPIRRIPPPARRPRPKKSADADPKSAAAKVEATPAASDTSATSSDAVIDEALQQLPAEFAEIEPLVAKLETDATANPKDHALNEYRYLDARLRADLQYLRDMLPFAGNRTKEVETAIAQLELLRQQLAPALATATKWHEDNPAGKSLGMWNEEVGTELAGLGLSDYDKGGIYYVSGTILMADALGIAFLDAAESLLTFGFHETATAVSQAYTAGDLSWNEGEKLLDESADRAIVIAVATRGAGALFSRLGAATATALRIAPTATRFALVAGGIEGGLTATAALGTQALYTKLLERSFNSPRARAIWSRGIPSGTDWAIVIPLGIFFGSAGAVNALNKANANLVGQVVQTPAGELEIMKVVGDRILLKPRGSTVTLPEPPLASGALVYDGATRSWSLELPESSLVPLKHPAAQSRAGGGAASINAANDAALVSKPADTVGKAPAVTPDAEVTSSQPPVSQETPLVSQEPPLVSAEKPAVAGEALESHLAKVETQAPPLQSVAPPIANQTPKVRAGSARATSRLAAADEVLATTQKASANAAQKVKAAKTQLEEARGIADEYGTKDAKKLVNEELAKLASAEKEFKAAQRLENLATQERAEAASAAAKIAELEDKIAALEAAMEAELNPPELPPGRGRWQIPGWSEPPAIKGGRPYRELEHSRNKALDALEAEKKNLTKSLAERSTAATPGESGKTLALENAGQLSEVLRPKNGMPIDVTTGQPMKPTDVWRADHIISRSAITKDPRMLRLTAAQQDAMWHTIAENLMPITESANSSKGGRSISEWIKSRRAKGEPLPDDMAKALLKAEERAQLAIEAKFKEFLGK